MMKKLTKDKAPMLPEPQGRHKDMLNKLNIGKALIISEAEKRHIKDVQRIEDTLKAAPDKKKYLALEKDIVFRILRKDIDKANDCYETIVAGQKTRYYRTGQFYYDIEQIKLIRHHYRLYLRGGIVNYAEETLTPKADNIINAIRFYQLETYLENYKPEVAFEPQKRTLADIALQYVWEGKAITNKNKHEVAAQFPELNLKNGTKLYNKFLYYSHKTNRVNYDGSENNARNYLKDMERALSFLTNPEHIKVAEKEIHEYKRHNNLN